MSYRDNSSSYFPDVFSKTKTTINRISNTIKKRFPECRGVVSADGLSGSTLVVPVALKLDLPFGFVRTKTSHSTIGVEHHLALQNVVIIDDFISSGTTMSKTIRKLLKEDIDPIGIVCYGGRTDHNRAMKQWDDFLYYKKRGSGVPTLVLPQWRPEY